jgi:hypothetical protein
MRLGYEKCLFIVVGFNKMDVTDEKSKQELSKLTPPDIVNKAKTVTSADCYQKNQNSFVPYEKFYYLFMI